MSDLIGPIGGSPCHQLAGMARGGDEWQMVASHMRLVPSCPVVTEHTERIPHKTPELDRGSDQ